MDDNHYDSEGKDGRQRKNVPRRQVFVVGSEMSVRNRRIVLRSAAFGGALGKGAVVICTYGIVSANPAMFDPLRGDGRNHKWDYVVLDEGHKIKNPSTK